MSDPELAEESCVPCRGDTPPLEPAERERLLGRLGPGWRVVEGHHLERHYEFQDFQGALDFVNRIGAVAEAEGHHPDIELGWGRCVLRIHTHAIDGLTASDFVLAAKADRALSGGPAGDRGRE
jgi:4a-hydroxytetrahydrobiopterin dehydratase